MRNIHTKVGYPSEERICPDCGKTVKGNNQLTLHIRKKHLNIKNFQCDLCTLSFYGKYELRSHLIHAHMEFKECHPCTLCPSVLSSGRIKQSKCGITYNQNIFIYIAIGLKVHSQHKHSNLRPYACFCGKSFSLRETLKTHIRNVHKGERKFGMRSTFFNC